MKVDAKIYARYKTQSKRKNSQGSKLRHLHIIKEPHYNKKYKKGQIICVKDLLDIENSTITKVFYVNNLEILKDDKFSEGNPPSK